MKKLEEAFRRDARKIGIKGKKLDEYVETVLSGTPISKPVIALSVVPEASFPLKRGRPKKK